MSNSTASAHTTATRSSQRKRKTEPARVVETYWYEVKARGQWGAFTRTAAVHHISDESVRRYVKQATQPAAPPMDAELIYQPAPGEKPVAPRILPQQQRRARPSCHAQSPKRMMHKIGFLCKPVRSHVAKVAQNQTATFHSSERETVRLDAGILPQSAPRPRPARGGLDLAQLVDVLTYQVGPVPIVAWLVFLVFLWLMAR